MIKNSLFKIKNLAVWLSLLITLVYSFHVLYRSNLFTPKYVIAWDVNHYYDYLPAAFILHDLKTMESDDPSVVYWALWLPNGNSVSKTTMGVAFCYAPFFLVANALAEPLGYVKNGFTEPYAWALVFSSIFYLFWGFYFLFKTLKKLGFSDLVTSIVVAAIGLCTNLYWYATFSAPYSHSYSFTAITLFLYLTLLWHEKPCVKNSIFVGLTAGLLTLMRPSNIVVVLVFVFYNARKFGEVKDKMLFFLKEYKQILIIVVCAICVWVPQFVYWKVVTGSLFFYSYGDDERFFFNDPKIYEVLFGWRKGWLVYTPVMVFSVIGLFMLPWRRKDFSIGIIAFFVLQVYIISSWWCWWYGGSYGMRPMIDVYGIMAVPFAVFLQWLFENKRLTVKIPILLLFAWLAFRSAFNTYRYYTGAIHYESMSKKAYFYSYWGDKTGEFNSLLENPNYKAAKLGKR